MRESIEISQRQQWVCRANGGTLEVAPVLGRAADVWGALTS